MPEVGTQLRYSDFISLCLGVQVVVAVTNLTGNLL